MGNALQIGSFSKKCDQTEGDTLKTKFLKLMTDLNENKMSTAALQQEAQDLDTVCISFQSSKPPGFFQRLNTTCSATGTEVGTYLSPSFSPIPDPNHKELPQFQKITDNVGIWHSKVEVDWVRVGLSAGVLFLFLVVIILLMRGSGSAPQLQYGYA